MLESDLLNRELFIINAALTGMVPTKADTPHVPVSVEETADDAEAAAEAGAAIIHLHPRDNKGRPTSDPDIYRRLIAAVRERCPDLVICASCSGRNEQDGERRAAPLTFEDELKPELASLTCGSMNFARQASLNAPDTIVELARRMQDNGIKAEVEVFEPGMINYVCYLISKGILEESLYCNILLGNLGTSRGTGLDLSYMVNCLPEGTTWGAAGIGRYQLPVTAMALAMGGSVRTGLEDNIHYDWQERALATNRMLIERVVRIGHELGRRPATPQETREMIGLPTKRL